MNRVKYKDVTPELRTTEEKCKDEDKDKNHVLLIYYNENPCQ